MFAISPAEWVVLVVWVAGVAAAVYSVRGNVLLSRRLLVLTVATFLPLVGSIVGFVLAVLRFRQDRSAECENVSD